MSLPAEEKRHYVSVMQHTLHAVRTIDRTIEFCAECALPDKEGVKKLLQAWSENVAGSAIVAIAPEPVWWHLGDSAGTPTLQTDADVRRFAARLPHHLRGPLEIMACNAADGRGVSPDGGDRWLLGVTQGDALATAAAEAIERGVVTAAIGSATLDSVAAAVAAVRVEDAGVVQLWAIGDKESYVFTISVRGIEAIDRCATGFQAIFAAVQQVFGLKTLADAKALFFEKPADPAAAAHLASVIAPQLQGVRGAKTGGAPVSFACAGLTIKEGWFGRAIAQAMALPSWQPDLNGYLDHLQLKLAAEPGDVPSLSLLGTLHLAAIHPGPNAAWHPSWGVISRPAVSTEILRPTHAAIAPAPSPMTAAVTVAGPAVRPEVPPQSPAIVLPGTSTEPPVPPRVPAPPVSVPVARQEDESKAGAATAGPPAPAPSTSESSPERRLPSPQRTPVIPPAVPAASAAKSDANGRTDCHLPAPMPLSPINPTAPSSQRTRISPVTARAVPPVSLHAESSRANRRPSSASNGDRKLPPPPWSPEEESSPPPEPTVIILRRSGYWPVVGIVLALFGAGLAAKFYLDAEAVKLAAQKESRAAEQAHAMAEREIAAATEQVRLASEQAALADVRARELATASAREIERVRSSTEAARGAAIAQVRREALEQARREAEERTVRLLARELTAARAAVAPGSLKITSVPAGADVHLEGRPTQRAPVSIEGLPPGRHALRLTLAGHVPRELTADIVAAKTTDLGSIKLERAIGAVAVSSSPAESEFSIRLSSTPPDAAPLRRGRTPAQLDDLPAGEYVVQFSRAGWPDRTERVTVEGGATARVAASFQGGTVLINSSPTGATVLQGGLLLGKTPLTLGGVPPQKVSYELSAHGYEPLKMSGTVEEGRELELNGTLLDLNRLVRADEVRTPRGLT